MYNKDQYLKELDNIRNRIYVQQQNRKNKDHQNVVPLDRKERNERNGSGISKPPFETLERNSRKEDRKNDSYQPVQQMQARKPLESKNNRQNIVQQRVKQLQSMSDKIKKALSTKRQPSQYRITANQTPKMTKNLSNFQQLKTNEVKMLQKQNHNRKMSFHTSIGIDRTFQPFKNVQNNQYPMRQRQSQLNLISNIKNQNIFAHKIERNLDSSLANVMKSQNKVQKDGLLRPNLMRMQSREEQDIIPLSLKTENSESNEISNISFNCQSHSPRKDPIYQSQPIQPNIKPEKKQIKQRQTQNKLVYTHKQPQITHTLQPSSETNKLINLLLTQVQLQITFRNNKQKYAQLRQKNKLQQLKKVLKANDIDFRQSDLLAQINIQEEEYDPFMEQEGLPFNYQDFVQSMMAARNHWQKQLKRSVKLSQLKKQGFNLKGGPLNMNETLKLQELVCYINIKVGSVFRNRDLFNLLKRCILLDQNIKQNGLKMSTLMNYVSQE